MQRYRAPITVAMFTLALVSLPAVVLSGAFYLGGWGCLCNSSMPLQETSWFPVRYIPDDFEDCAEPLSAAFRIVGVPDDPALQRNFHSNASMSGDVFGEGAVFTGLGPFPGELTIGYVQIYVTTQLADQVWSLEAHQGIEGTSLPVMEFNSARGTWIQQPAHSFAIVSPSPSCETCEYPFVGCPFAVESQPWSTIKQLYQ